jgi:hypothetical protein
MIDNAPTRPESPRAFPDLRHVAMRIESNTSVTCSDAGCGRSRAPIDPRYEQAEHQRAKQAQQHATAPIGVTVVFRKSTWRETERRRPARNFDTGCV